MEALPVGREQFKSLTDEEKEPFKKKEQKWKEYMRGPAGDKYRKNCSGENMLEERLRLEREEKFEDIVKQSAVQYILPKETAVDRAIFFLAFEYALQDDQKRFYPNEVSLVKYTLRSGVISTMHYFLHPGEYPLGTKAAAKEHSEKRHKIPFLGFEKATDGYSAVFAHMRTILMSHNGCDSDSYPPIFCHPDQVESTRGCMEMLFQKATRHPSEKIDVILSATTLLVYLLGEDKCGETKANEIFKSSTFDQEHGTACDWHFEQDCIFCASATARKMAYALSDNLKVVYNFSLTPNHLPTVRSLPEFSSQAEFIPFTKPKRSTHRQGC